MKRAALLAAVLVACSTPDTASQGTVSLTEAGRAAAPIAADAVVYDLGGDFGWAEGPVYVREAAGGYLLLTDVPGRTIWRYDEEAGLTEWMQPSVRPGADVAEDAEGANGLFLLDDRTLLVPDHGSRSLYTLDLDTREVAVLADSYDDQPLNSPNDVVVHGPSGTLYFTDPPYGLDGGDDDPAKALDFNGVFALSDTSLSVVDRTLSRPNGIALSPDARTLYVSNSEPSRSVIKAYDVDASGAVSGGRVWVDLTAERDAAPFGNLDGMAVSTDGTVFATGPGGVWVLDPDGRELARIEVGAPCANVTFGDFAGSDNTTLFMACHKRLFAVDTNRTGLN